MIETARDAHWFDTFTRREQIEYLKAHPHSKMKLSAKNVKPKSRGLTATPKKKPTVNAPVHATAKNFSAPGVTCDDPDDTELHDKWNRTFRHPPLQDPEPW